MAKPFGVTYAPITYPGDDVEDFGLVRQEKPDAPELGPLLAAAGASAQADQSQEYPEVADVRLVRASRGLEEAGRSPLQELDI